MASVNLGSIAQKCDAYFASSEGQRALGEGAASSAEAAAKAVEYANAAADALIHYIDMSASTSIPPGVASLVEGAFSKGGATVTGVQNNKLVCEITVSSEDLARPSLYPGGGGVYDLIGLYDAGVDHQMKRVFGTWHGARVGSRTIIPPTNFIEFAIQIALANKLALHIIDCYRTD